MACCCELQNTLEVEVTQDTLDVEIGGSAGVLLQAKSVDVTENGTSVVSPDDGFDGLSGVEINTNVPKRFECGDAVFDTDAYNGGVLGVDRITKINVSCLVTAQTTSTVSLFFKFYILTEIIGLESWDTSSVTDMNRMFSGCSSLQKLDVSNFDTSNVTIMHDMFFGCTSLQSLDVSHFDTSKDTTMRYMFGMCTSLKSLNISGIDASSVTNADLVFVLCQKLLTIIGDHTLQDVENGLKTMIGIKVNISTNYSPLRFSSILALANGLADLTGATAQTLTISGASYNNMYNDDDTKPTAEVISERQARIAAICAAKNWNFAH